MTEDPLLPQLLMLVILIFINAFFASSEIALISLLRYAVVILPLAFVLNLLWGPVGVWHAFWITEVIAAAVSWAVCRKKVFSAME